MYKLIHFQLCPFSRAIRIAMAELGLEVELVVEHPWEWQPEFLALNPAGELPVLQVEDGPTLCGAYAISEYLTEEIAESQPERGGAPLFPGNRAERAEVRRLVDWFNGKFNREVTHELVLGVIHKEDAQGTFIAPVSGLFHLRGLYRRSLCFAPRTGQHLKQVRLFNGFQQVVCKVQFPAARDIVHLVVGSEHHQVCVCQALVFLYMLSHLESIHPSHAASEQQQLVGFSRIPGTLEFGNTLFAALGFSHQRTRSSEHPLENLPTCRAIIHHQNSQIVENFRQLHCALLGPGGDLLHDPADSDLVEFVKDHSGGRGANIAAEAVGKPRLVAKCVEVVRPRGQVLMIGVSPEGAPLPVDLYDMHYREITLKGAFGRGNVFDRTPEEINNLNLDGVISGRYELGEVPQAIVDSGEGKGVKFIIKPNG